MNPSLWKTDTKKQKKGARKQTPEAKNGYKKAEKGRKKTDPRGKIGVKCGNNSVF